MNQAALFDLAAVAVIAAALGSGALLVFVVVPLLMRVRTLTVATEKLVQDLDVALPALVKQTNRTLVHLDATLVDKLPNLVTRTTRTLELLEGSLSAELPGLIRETTHTVRRLNGDRPAVD